MFTEIKIKVKAGHKNKQIEHFGIKILGSLLAPLTVCNAKVP